MLKGTNAQRDAFIKEVAARGGEVGIGFRGFASRSSNRCRKFTDLNHTQQVAERTIVIHHRHLQYDSHELENFSHQLNLIAEEVMLGSRDN